MIDQLAIAKNYLKLETVRVSNAYRACDSAQTTQRGFWRSGRAGDDRAGATIGEDEEDVDFSKTNIWTVAYGGNSRQLQAYLEKLKKSDAIHGVGYVNLRHRQWGIKRAAEEYQLGLGMKATPLQFAAVARRLDNVIVLLSNGARDDTEPRLKALVSPETYEVIMSVTGPKKTAAKPSSPPAAVTANEEEAAGKSTQEELEARPADSGPEIAPAALPRSPPEEVPIVPQFTHISIQPVMLTL